MIGIATTGPPDDGIVDNIVVDDTCLRHAVDNGIVNYGRGVVNDRATGKGHHKQRCRRRWCCRRRILPIVGPPTTKFTAMGPRTMRVANNGVADDEAADNRATDDEYFQKCNACCQ